MSDWSLTDTQLLAAAILGIGFIVLIVTAFRKPTVPRKEFARLQEGVKRLSEEVKELQAAEQRRFIKELKGSEKTTKSRWRRLNPPAPTAPPSEERVN